MLSYTPMYVCYSSDLKILSTLINISDNNKKYLSPQYNTKTLKQIINFSSLNQTDQAGILKL